jgi:hypothetical protein
LVFFQPVRWRGSSFGVSLLIAISSATLADAFDFFIDLGILRTLGPYCVVSFHRRSVTNGAVDATARRSTGRVARRSDNRRLAGAPPVLDVEPDEFAVLAELMPGCS